MIHVKFSGGLGNQLFQYCAAVEYAKHHSSVVSIDISDYTSNKEIRDFDLSSLINLDELSTVSMKRYHSTYEKLVFKIFTKLNFLSGVFYSSNENISKRSLRKDISLYGYWQNYELICNAVPELKIKIEENYILSSSDIANKINSVHNPISMHVRRGDYFSTKDLTAKYGVCDTDYFLRAISELNITDNSEIFVFSDDPDWVTDNLAEHIGCKFTIVSNDKKLKATDELILMSMCKQHIISNSTFSWWGAVLAKSNKVVAPKSWFVKLDRPELIPTGWFRI
ncbi:hypothetical protein ACS79_21510 [Vibrio lentus]|nr:hypothetical protein ACS79_21510 [Vibrio lentus]